MKSIVSSDAPSLHFSIHFGINSISSGQPLQLTSFAYKDSSNFQFKIQITVKRDITESSNAISINSEKLDAAHATGGHEIGEKTQTPMTLSGRYRRSVTILATGTNFGSSSRWLVQYPLQNRSLLTCYYWLCPPLPPSILLFYLFLLIQVLSLFEYYNFSK
jgi:hypothetical protein